MAHHSRRARVGDHIPLLDEMILRRDRGRRLARFIRSVARSVEKFSKLKIETGFTFQPGQPVQVTRTFSEA